MFTFLGDNAVADEVLFVGDQDDDIVAFGRSQVLQTRLRKDERRSVGHRVNDKVRVYLFSVITCLVSRLQRPHTVSRLPTISIVKRRYVNSHKSGQCCWTASMEQP